MCAAGILRVCPHENNLTLKHIATIPLSLTQHNLLASIKSNGEYNRTETVSELANIFLPVLCNKAFLQFGDYFL